MNTDALALLDKLCREYDLAHNAFHRYMLRPGTTTGQRALADYERRFSRLTVGNKVT